MSTPTPLWKTLENEEETPYKLSAEYLGRCFYAYDYTSGAGYSTGPNNVIINFKKEESRRDNPEWKHRKRAVRQIAANLSSLVGTNIITIIAIPPSRPRGHPGYSTRFDDLFAEMQRTRIDGANWTTDTPIVRSSPATPSHLGGERSPTERMKTLEWRGFTKATPGGVLIFDDVITSGGSFEACRRMIHSRHPKLEVWGAFWAHTVHACPVD